MCQAAKGKLKLSRTLRQRVTPSPASRAANREVKKEASSRAMVGKQSMCRTLSVARYSVCVLGDERKIREAGWS